MAGVLDPKESSAYIASLSKNVKILEDGVFIIAEQVVNALKNKSLAFSKFTEDEFKPKSHDQYALDWIFLVETLNYCFWSRTDQEWTVTYKNKPYTGYFALCAAVNRAIEEGINIVNPEFYSKLSVKELNYIFRGDDVATHIPLIVERQQCLEEVGTTLINKFSGTFAECVRAAKGSAKKLLKIIVKNFGCFRDENKYKGRDVALYKRAQILVGDVWSCFRGKDLGNFHDIECISMFADYRVPQVLVYFDAMEYSPELMRKLEAGDLLDNGSEEEIEIRGCSIHACELILRQAKKILPTIKVKSSGEEGEIVCNSILIHQFLWNLRRVNDELFSLVPFHKTNTIFY